MPGFQSSIQTHSHMHTSLEGLIAHTHTLCTLYTLHRLSITQPTGADVVSAVRSSQTTRTFAWASLHVRCGESAAAGDRSARAPAVAAAAAAKRATDERSTE